MKKIPNWQVVGKTDKTKIPYSDIDKNLREIIKLFNEIPWLATSSCCEGHPRKVCKGNWEANGGISLYIYDEEKWHILIGLFDLECQEHYEDFNISIDRGFRYSKKRGVLVYSSGISWSSQAASKEKCVRRLKSTWCKLEFYLRKYLELEGKVDWEKYLSQ